MAKTLARGTKVRLIQRVIEGEIIMAETNGDTFGYRVAYTTEDGEVHERFFEADLLETVEPSE
jgi:GTP-sensing pleiotropic transcriptional regulator CodY